MRSTPVESGFFCEKTGKLQVTSHELEALEGRESAHALIEDGGTHGIPCVARRGGSATWVQPLSAAGGRRLCQSVACWYACPILSSTPSSKGRP